MSESRNYSCYGSESAIPKRNISYSSESHSNNYSSESHSDNFFSESYGDNFFSSNTKNNNDTKDTKDTIDDLINKFRKGKINSDEFADLVERANRDSR